MKANQDIEEGKPAKINIVAKAIKGRKLYARIFSKDSWPKLDEKTIVDLDNLRIEEHMGRRYLQLDTQDGETIYLPIEKWHEIEVWIKEQEQKRRDKR